MVGVNDFSIKQILLLGITLIGALEGFSEAPRILDNLLSFQICNIKIMKWIIFFSIIYQYGSGRHFKISLFIVIALFIICRLLSYFDTEVDGAYDEDKVIKNTDKK